MTEFTADDVKGIVPPIATPINKDETDYRWLTQVYESVKPSSGTGKLLWRALGAKTTELVHETVQVNAVRDDLDTLVMDAELLEAVLGTPDPDTKSKEIEIKIAQRLRKHLHDPRFRELGERLEDLEQRHEQGLLVSIDFLKNLLDLARDVVAVEQVAEPLVKEELGKAALTELFEEAKNDKTHIMVERLVNDIDEIVRLVRFDGWQNTHAGESEVKLVLRKTLFKYKLHQDQDCQGRSESVPAVLIVSVGKTNLPLSEMGFRGKVIPPKTDTDFWEYQYSTRKEQPANSWLYEITYEGQRFSIYVPHEVMEGKPAPKRLIVRVGVPE